jgi:trehalose 2-sulfotransferase
MAGPEHDTYDRLYFEFERTEPRLSYMVCSVPRSGSSLLCELLAGTGIAGAPAEFLHPDKRAALSRRWGVETLDEYVRELLTRKTSPNGAFGIKAHWGQYQPAFGERDPRAVFPHASVVLITREDRLRQAISWVRALQTNRWADQDRPRVERSAEFDYEHISRKLRRIDREEGFWQSLCERYGIAPHRVVYEELVADRDRVVRDVLEAVGVEVPADLDLPGPVLGPQADEQSDEWVERYRAVATSPGPARGDA